MAAILDAILNISISPMMPRWHHSVSMYGHVKEHIYAKTFCADYLFRVASKIFIWKPDYFMKLAFSYLLICVIAEDITDKVNVDSWNFFFHNGDLYLD